MFKSLRFSLGSSIWVLCILQVAFGLRIGAAVYWQKELAKKQGMAFEESIVYWELANSIAKGLPYEYSDRRLAATPGYPALLAPLFWMAGQEAPPVIWARIEGALLGTLSVGLVMLLTYRLFESKYAAFIAGGLTALAPGQIEASIVILAYAPFMCLMLGQLLVWSEASQRMGRGQLALSVGAGVLGGLATLVSPVWLLFTPFALAFQVIFSERRLRDLMLGCVILATLCLTMSGWWIRNYYVLASSVPQRIQKNPEHVPRTFVPTTLTVGEQLRDGLHDAATGGSNLSTVCVERDLVDRMLVKSEFPLSMSRAVGWHFIDVEQWVPDELVEEIDSDPELFRVNFQATEDVLDRALSQSAIDWARRNPEKTVQLAAIKLLRMWGPFPAAKHPLAEGQNLEARLRQYLYAALTIFVLACGLVGVWRFRHRGFAFWLLILPAVYLSCAHLILPASFLDQQPAIVGFFVIAGGILVRPCETTLRYARTARSS
jgi:hypothetical protein